MQYHSPLCSLPWLKLSGQSSFQSWNVSVSEQCWSVIALQSLMWYLEVRSKRCSIPAAASLLNSSDLEGPFDGAISEVLNKTISRWNPVVCFRGALLKFRSSQPVPARWNLRHVPVHPGAASSNCTAVIPSGAVGFITLLLGKARQRKLLCTIWKQSSPRSDGEEIGTDLCPALV